MKMFFKVLFIAIFAGCFCWMLFDGLERQAEYEQAHNKKICEIYDCMK